MRFAGMLSTLCAKEESHAGPVRTLCALSVSVRFKFASQRSALLRTQRVPTGAKAPLAAHQDSHRCRLPAQPEGRSKTLATRAPPLLARLPQAPPRLRRGQPQASKAARSAAQDSCKDGRVKPYKSCQSRHLLPFAVQCRSCKDGRVGPKNHINPGALQPARDFLQTRTRLPPQDACAIKRP